MINFLLNFFRNLYLKTKKIPENCEECGSYLPGITFEDSDANELIIRECGNMFHYDLLYKLERMYDSDNTNKSRK